jgi:Tfp pilus assembly protein PilO
MRAADRSIIVGFAIAGLLAAFWFLVLSPKREEASELQDRVEQLQASVAQEEQIAAAAEQAREEFDANYQRLVVLGKAVPEDEDTASLFVQLERIAEKAKVEFRAIRLEEGRGGAVPPPPAPSEGNGGNGDGGDGGDGAGSGGDGEPPPQPAPPTEVAVAGLPIGATAGPAGLPVMPYLIEVTGTFFEVADFLDGIDALVRPRDQRPRVQGRLVTIDGFGMEADSKDGFPKLETTLAVTTFVTPADQGLTAGASPAGPPPAVPTANTTDSTP